MTPMLLNIPIFNPDAVPNRFLTGSDWQDPRYRQLLAEFTELYRDQMQGEPHPFGATNPTAVAIHWSREWEYPWAVLNAQVQPGMTVADLGCGGSPLLPYLAALGCRCTGIDQILLSITGRNNLRGFREHPSVLFPEIAWLQEDMSRTSLHAASQDRIFCISVLEHIPAEVAAATMHEIARILTPRGLALITTDIGGAHRKLTSTYQDLIAMANAAGLRLHGHSDWTPPAATPGEYEVVGFVLSK